MYNANVSIEEQIVICNEKYAETIERGRKCSDEIFVVMFTDKWDS